MSLKSLMNYTFVSKYARWLPEKNRRETWNEAVDRVKQMMLDKYADKNVAEYIDFAYESMRKKKVLGSQRALQFGGDPIFSHNSRIYNCITSFVDRPRFFQECMYLLLCGCGTGFSVQRHHIAKLPKLRQVSAKGRSVKHIIGDNIEGWSDAIGILVSTYFEDCDLFPEYVGKSVAFDYSKIRPAGSYLKSSGGKAPGPEPLKKALNNIKKVLDRAVKNGQEKLKPIDAYDIVMFAADAVISGGVRRSATICVFSPDDEEMAKAKTGSWFIDNPQRGRSNNSALLLRDETSKEQFEDLMNSVKEFGEPGFVWSDSTELIVNPCVTIDTKVLTDSGWIEFKELLHKDKFLIEQDSRVIGRISNSNEEYWTVDMNQKNENIINVASNARMTGENRDVYELELSCGRKVKATDNHHFATPNGMVELKDLTEEDEILIPLSSSYYSDKNSDNFKLGYLVGLIHGDGCFVDKNTSTRFNLWGTKEELELEITKIEKYIEHFISLLRPEELTYNQNLNPKFTNVSGKIYGNKDKWTIQSSAFNKYLNSVGIPSKKDDINFIHKKDKDFKAGFVSGMLYADGHSEYNENSKSLSVRLSSVNIKTLQDIQLVLQELGIFSRINTSREAGKAVLLDENRNKKAYNTQKSYRLIIGGQQNCFNLLKAIELHPKDHIRVTSVIGNRSNFRKTNRFSSYVKNITYIGKENVYCLTENNRRTMIVNGMTSRRCVEIGMWPVDETTGETGWQACNLSTINCAKVKTEQDFYDACKAAAIIGTLQAGFAEFEYLGSVSERIVKREALLGVSMTGIMERHDICLDPEVQKNGAEIVKKVNAEIAELIDINQAARTTCVKPEGTSSCILGTSSGIHPHHAKRYIRRVQANKMEPIYQYFKEQNPRACAESVWSNNDSDDVVAFCVEVPDGSKLKNQVNATDLLEYVKSTQQNWVMNGTNPELCTQKWLVHNVSNTINVKPEEWDAVTDFIYDNRQYFCGVSLLPIAGDKDYAQAPFTTVYLPSEQIQHYGDAAMFVSGLIEVGLQLYDDNLWAACDSLLGFGQKIKGTEKKAYLDRCQRFADKYMNGDLKLLTYCMKDVYNWKDWIDMKREYVDVDYTNVIEEENNVDPVQEISCAGGKCDLI